MAQITDLGSAGVATDAPAEAPESGSQAGHDVATSALARFWESTRHFVRNQPLGVAAGLFILVLVIMALFAPLVSNFDPEVQNRRDIKIGPNSQFWLGTDHLGRDIYSRLAYGARVSLTVAGVTVLISTVGGIVVGGISGYFGGRVDLVLQRIVDAIMSIPVLILALFIVALLGPSMRNVILALAIIYTPRFTRIARGEMLRIKSSDYVTAAEAMGARPFRTILRHGVPNLMAPIIIMASLSFGTAIVAEAALSFIGLGVPPPEPSWGRMVSDAREWMRLYPWMLLAPATALALTVLAFNLFGDALRDHLDPKLVR